MRGAIDIDVLLLEHLEISTHTPHAGSDPHDRACGFRARISTHTPHAGSDSRHVEVFHLMRISTHTPHAGSDSWQVSSHSTRDRFQLTLPMRGAMCSSSSVVAKITISTHTPHAGSDAIAPPHRIRTIDFNSHSPCGERFRQITPCCIDIDFNSHSPCGER